MNSLTYRVPAKINLYLKLTGKRTDGYNNICTIFQKISLHDQLTITKAKRGCTIDVEGRMPCSQKKNLIYRAYRLIKETVRFTGGVHFRLKKDIPVGSGLGGASADAAYALVGINKLYKLGLKSDLLLELGRKLGADVPFFLYPYSTALGIERGDFIIDLGRKPRYWLLLVVFDISLSTHEVYRNFRYPSRSQLDLTKLSHDVIMLSQFLATRKLLSCAKFLKNDLYHSACDKIPNIREVLHLLKKNNISPCSMTGSGPTIFALFTDKKNAQQAQQVLVSYKGIKTFICQTVH